MADDFCLAKVFEGGDFIELEDVLEKLICSLSSLSGVQVRQPIAIGVNEDVSKRVSHDSVCEEESQRLQQVTCHHLKVGILTLELVKYLRDVQREIVSIEPVTHHEGDFIDHVGFSLYRSRGSATPNYDEVLAFRNDLVGITSSA